MESSLEVRVRVLERRTRRLGLLCVALALVAAATIGLGAASAMTRRIPDELVARSIRVVGEAGENGASLSGTEDGFVILSFTDLKGEQRFALLMTPSGKPTLMFSDGESSRLKLGVVDGSERGNEQFSLRARKPDGGTLWLPPFDNPWGDRSKPDKGDAYAKYWLRPVALARSRAFRSNELSEIQHIIEENADAFEEKWHEFFAGDR
jgi:hypothetical protein